MERNTKIVATLGPSSNDERMISSLIQAGMNVARLNFSHGTHAEHQQRINIIRTLSSKLNKPVSILQDLSGPKLRVGILPDAGIPLEAGQIVRLASGESALNGEATMIPMDVPNLTRAVEMGSRILLDDGNLEMEVISVEEGWLEAKVTLGGTLKSHKGVNLPGAKLDFPGFTEKDRIDLAFGLQAGVDIIAISFVKTAEDVLIVRKAIQQLCPNRADTPLIAKLERPEAMVNLQAIIDAADGVMVARGDLGVETSPSLVPVMQKRIIQAANRSAKVVITATQMLESMINSPRPTRAEASDVANAIFDGTDAVMLSGETAAGKYPLESVRMMHSIVCEAENNFSDWGKCENAVEEPTRDDAVSMTRAARELAHDRNVAAIAVFTQTGRTALLMSKARPRVPILALTPETKAYQRMSLYWGVTPYYVPFASSVEMMITHVEKTLLASSPLKPGEQVVMISGFPVGDMRQPNFALLHTIGQS